MTPYEVRKRMQKAFRKAFDLPDIEDRTACAHIYCELITCLTLADMHEDGDPWALAIQEKKLAKLRVLPQWQRIKGD